MKRIPVAATLLLAACAGSVRMESSARDGGTPPDAPETSITAPTLLDSIRTLASDEFEGRAPATMGEERTVDFLVSRLQAAGLEPGNPDGSFVQDVPLVGMVAEPSGSFSAGGTTIPMRFGEDTVGLTKRVVPEVSVDGSEVVFVGYGVVAPEYGWDDLKGTDLAGKTIVMLVNDPPVPDPDDPAELDDSMFRGRAMTYYGRWTYKYELAAEVGAAAAFVVHETGPAGYPWAVVQGSWGRENFDIAAADGNASRAAFEGWITREKAVELFASCGKDFDELKRSACSKDFRPVPLGATASLTVRNTLRRVASKNVVAKVTGSDPERRDEVVVYTAHWDHLGKSDAEGDNIYNGAVDNASGTAGLLEIARAFRRCRPTPPRTVVFLFVTAEEKGLLGSRWYAANPLYPLRSTLANINMDSLSTWGPTSDVVCVGYGQSTLDEILVARAAEQGRSVVPDAEPEKGYYYRSDHFEFAKVGVPAMYADGGISVIGKPPGYGLAKAAEYTANDYHKPSDEVRPEWDLSGAVRDLQLLFRVGHDVASTPGTPRWKDGSEFKAVREASLRTHG